LKISLFDFQETALEGLRGRLNTARTQASVDDPYAVSFSAPTGSGKTIVMTALFENIFFGDPGLGAQADAAILWISDMPELNEQTRLKIQGKSDRIPTGRLITVDTHFDMERLKGGYIYFMNTQKLGSDKLLTRKGDGRDYTIWETLTNTARSISDRFYVVIDEAHRGMRSGRAAVTAQTIMQKFLLGSEVDGLCRMPLVMGVSATPQRFNDLLAGTDYVILPVRINGEDVKESGLLKDRILIHHPDSSTQAEMTLLAEAADRWKRMEQQWAEYCNREGEKVVPPILVIQVEDAAGNSITKTNLSTLLSTIESAIDRRLREGEIAHAFNDSGDLDVDGRRVRRVEASRIEEDRNIGVVLFKMSLSTGWDCPRAEVMMSFRSAQDHTYIAQLLGRMVRTPLARRIVSDAALNDVHLFLPHYNQETVRTVIEDLQNVEDVPPTTTGSSRELVTLQRRDGLDELFAAMDDLITYRVNAVRKQSALRRLMGIARRLTHDQIDPEALQQVKEQIIGVMESEVQRLRDSGEFDERAQQITGIDLRTITLDHGTGVAEDGGEYTIEAASADIDHHFQQAGRRLGNGLEMEYWRAQDEDRDADEVKVEVVLLAQDQVGMNVLEAFCEGEFDKRYGKHRRAIAKLKEQQKRQYERLRLATSEPVSIPWELPISIDFRRTAEAAEYERHLYLEEDGGFRADLTTWEEGTLQEELDNPAVIGWLRNMDRKPWSLEVPYEYGGSVKPMFPDLVVVRKEQDEYIFDVLEPHDDSRSDNAAKAKGLAQFAEKHWDLFGRIQLIRKQRDAAGVERYFRLDVGEESVRREVLAVESDAHLDRIFGAHARVR